MEINKKVYKITFGGWYQRTTLHLTEIYEFLANQSSKLPLSKPKLELFHKLLSLKNVTREVGYLEYIKAVTHQGIEIRYFEDGLYILEIDSLDIKGDQHILQDYFDNIFHKAISYLFSLGAPTPKVLANIKTTHPIVVNLSLADPEKFTINQEEFGVVYSKITSADTTVYKTPSHIFIVVKAGVRQTLVRELVEMQIFFREFKDQLEKYLNIHRKVWEEISVLKERRQILGHEVEKVRRQLDSYQKTVSLINNRINQMNAYVHTRSSIAKNLQLEQHLITLYQYKFEVLLNTLDYIKEIWKMTTDYVIQAIAVITDIENQSTNNSLIALRIVTTLGAIAAVFGYLSKESLPVFTGPGWIYLGLVILITLIVNYLITSIFKYLRYKLKFTETASKI